MEGSATLALPPSAVLAVPCLYPALDTLLNSRGELEWSFDRTLAARALGRERALAMWGVLAGEPRFGIKFVTYLLFLAAWIALSVLRLFHLDGGVIWPYIAASAVTLVEIFGMTCFFFDTHIARLCVQTGAFFGNLAFALVSLTCFMDLWGYDERSVLAVVLLIIVLFVSIVDAFPPELRRLVGLPVSALLWLSFLTLLAVLELDRFPVSYVRTIDLGNLYGYGLRNVTISVLQLATDSTFAFCTLITRIAYYTWVHRDSNYLFRVCSPLRCAQDDDFVVMSWLGALKFEHRPRPSGSHLIVVPDGPLRGLVDSDARITWSFDNTLASWALGRDRADAVVTALHRGRFEALKTSAIMGFMLTYVLISVLSICGYIDLEVLCAVTVVQVAVDVYFFCFVFDAKIFTLIVSTFDFWLNLGLALIGSGVLGIMWGWDLRTVLAAPFLFLIIFVSSYDAFLPHAREAAAPFVFLILILFYLLIFALLHLGRIPGEVDVVLDLGLLGGLALDPVTSTLVQILNDVVLTHLYLFSRLLYNAVRNRRDPILANIGVPVIGAGDPSFTHFPVLNDLPFGLGRAFEASRRVSTLDTSVASENPAFSHALAREASF